MCLCASGLVAQDNAAPAPTAANVKYGPAARNVLDFWQAKSDKPTPVVIFFHGGGFVAGDKGEVASHPVLRQLYREGVSVISANYRFITGPEAAPFPAPMMDGARVIQFVRSKAAECNIDPGRIALMGTSAGANMSLWIALHDDLADPKSADPLARLSTRVSCVVSSGGQTSNDPRWVLEHIGGSPDVHPSLLPFYGAANKVALDAPQVRRMIDEASAINHATRDDPPIMLLYGGKLNNTPLPADAPVDQSIHHPMFGKMLKEKLDKLGVECLFYYGESPPPKDAVLDFLRKHLGVTATTEAPKQ